MLRQVGTVLVVTGLGLALTSGCGKSRTAITLAGSTAFQPFAEKLAEQYMAKHNDVAITVQGGGSAVGIQSALSGAAQIGMADLVKLPPEAKDLTSEAVARDGIAIIVHPANSITNLTLEQIRGVFSGALHSWKEVGGAARPINVVSREAGSGTRASFEQIVGGITLSPDAIVQDSNGTIRETVANDENAIGYLSHGLLNDKIKAVTVDGRLCTPETIAAGEYKLVRPVYLLTKGPPAGASREFIDYILSPEGQQIIQSNGLLPVK